MEIIKKNKLVFTLFFLSIIGIVLSFFANRSSIEQIERENFKDSMRDHTKIKLAITKDQISNMVYDLNAIAQEVAACDSIWDPKVMEILSVANRIDAFTYTAVADSKGNGYNSHGLEFNISDKEYFLTAMDGTVAFSEVLPSTSMPGKYVQIFACPIVSDQQGITGLTLGVLDLERFNQKIANNSVDTEGNFYIVDSNGNYISSLQRGSENNQNRNFWADLDGFQGMDKEISQIKSDFEQRKEGEFSFTADGERRFGCYMPIGTRNWQIVYTIEDASVDKKIHAIFRIDTGYAIAELVCYLIWISCISWYFKKANHEIQQTHQELSRNIEFLYIALESSKQPVFEYDGVRRKLTQKTKFYNPLFQGDVESVSPESFVVRNIIAQPSIVSFMQLFEQIKTQQDARAEIQINDGETPVWLRISLHNIYKENAVISTVGFVEDITELKAIEEQAQQKLEIQHTLIANALLYVKVDMATQCLQEINGEESALLFDDFLRGKVMNHVRPEDKDMVAKELSLENLQRCFQQGADVHESQFVMDFDGTAKWVSCMAYRNTAMESNLILIIHDIDDKKRHELALQHQAERDGLTGLYNAATARIKIEQALAAGYLAREKQLFVLFDLDNYKLINDSFGHSCGDKVLIEVAEILKTRFRSSDIVGRMGGDEFVVLLRNVTSFQRSEALVQELCEKIHKTYAKDGKQVVLSASIGIAQAPLDGHSFTELYEKSDIALYQVKNKSKNGYRYYDAQGDA